MGCASCEVAGSELPDYDAELSYEGKAVGRVTSAVRDDGRVIALAYVRREVPADAQLEVDGKIRSSIGRLVGTTSTEDQCV